MPTQKTHAEDGVQQWQRKHAGEFKAPFDMPAPLPARTNGRPVILKGNKLKMNKMEDFFQTACQATCGIQCLGILLRQTV